MIAAQAADSKKASDILIQEVGPLLKITDYFVIATGKNDRQVDAIADEVEEQLAAKAGRSPFGREGTDSKDWVLLDYGDVIVHIFTPQTRDYYRLENLWSDAKIVALSEAGISDFEYSDRIAKIVEAANAAVDANSEAEEAERE